MGRRKKEKTKQWTEKDLERNSQIVEEFYSIYFRSPLSEEFYDCGGSREFIVDEYQRYCTFLECIGYPRPSKSITLELIDGDGDVVFTGISKDIAEELEIGNNMISLCLRKQLKIRRKYYLREKKFNKELFLKHMKGEILLYD